MKLLIAFIKIRMMAIIIFITAPMPKPRTQMPPHPLTTSMDPNISISSKEKSITSPNRKKPIPEPRSGLNSSQATSPHNRPQLTQDNTKIETNFSFKSHNLSSSSITKTIKNYLPEVPKPGATVNPVPTSEFQSFRRSSKSTTSVPSVLNKGDPDNAIKSTLDAPITTPTQKQYPPLQRHNALSGTLSGSSAITSIQSSDSSNELKNNSPKPLFPSKNKTSPYLPEYVNTTPPAVPARNPPSVVGLSSSTRPMTDERLSSNTVTAASNGSSRKSNATAEMLQHSQQPSSRRFSGDYVSIQSSELNDSSRLVTPMAVHGGRRSSAESNMNKTTTKETHVNVGRRSSNPLPPPPPLPPMGSSNHQSPVPMSFPYYVSDLYEDEIKEHPSIQNSQEQLSTSTSNNTSRAIKNMSCPQSSSRTTTNNSDLPPSFTPSTYKVYNINQGKPTKDASKKS